MLEKEMIDTPSFNEDKTIKFLSKLSKAVMYLLIFLLIVSFSRISAIK